MLSNANLVYYFFKWIFGVTEWPHASMALGLIPNAYSPETHGDPEFPV